MDLPETSVLSLPSHAPVDPVGGTARAGVGTGDVPGVTPRTVGGVLQTGPDPTGGGPLAILVTFLLAALFYAVTLHLAATFFIGDVPSQRAAYVGPVPALVSILLGRFGLDGLGPLSPGLTLALAMVATLVADAIAISAVYRISWKPTAALTALHFAFAAVLGIALNGIFGFV